jgi:hypothetical protein
MEFVFDCGEGAEDEIGGISHYGSAAWGDAVFGLKAEEAGEEFADGDGGLEIGQSGGEGGGEVDGSVFVLRKLGVVDAKERFLIWDRHAATGAVTKAMLTTVLSRCLQPCGDRWE